MVRTMSKKEFEQSEDQPIRKIGLVIVNDASFAAGSTVADVQCIENELASGSLANSGGSNAILQIQGIQLGTTQFTLKPGEALRLRDFPLRKIALDPASATTTLHAIFLKTQFTTKKIYFYALSHAQAILENSGAASGSSGSLQNVIINNPAGTSQAGVSAPSDTIPNSTPALQVMSQVMWYNPSGSQWERGYTAGGLDNSSGVTNVMGAINPISFDQIANKSILTYAIQGVNASVSAANASQTKTIELRNIATVISVILVSSGVSVTDTITVFVSVDNVTFIQNGVFTPAAGATTSGFSFNNQGGATPQSENGTFAYTVNTDAGVDPRAFRYVKLVVAAAGVGITTTLTVSAK